MTKLCLLVLIGALVASAVAESNPPVEGEVFPPQPTNPPPQPTNPPPQPPTPSPQPPTPSPTTSTTTTEKPTVPTKPTEKPTVPTKPTSPPTKPTSPPTTPTSPPTTPTSPPTKPTSPPTPPPPRPVDPPSMGLWELNYTKSNTTCMLLQFAMQIEVPYQVAPNKTYTAHVNVPPNATVSGACAAGNSQQVDLKWAAGTNLTDNLSLTFLKNDTTEKYVLAVIDITLASVNKSFPGFNGSQPIHLWHKHNEFQTSVKKSYKCSKKQELNLTDDSAKLLGSLTISQLQFEVFHNSTDKKFTNIEDCSPFDTPDIVPIAVGCALAALVIIVLVAYLIGRRRRQARGYLSMFTETKRESDYIPMKNLSCFQ